RPSAPPRRVPGFPRACPHASPRPAVALYTRTTVRMPPMPDPTPRIESAPESARVLVLGQWTAPRLADRRRLGDLLTGLGLAAASTWDLSAAQLDHVGAQLLWDQWGQRWPEHVEATPAQRAVLERVAKFTVHPPRRQRPT